MNRIYIVGWLWACSVIAQAAGAQTAPATSDADAKGVAWVGLTYRGPDGHEERYRWNPQTGAWAASQIDHGVVIYVEYKDPVTGEQAEYHASVRDGTKAQKNSGAVMISGLFPYDADTLKVAAAAPLTFPELLAAAKKELGDGGIRVSQVEDRGMIRVELEKGGAPLERTKSANESHYERGRQHFNLTIPSTLWIDPKSQGVREIHNGTVDGKFDYAAAAVGSVYDMGARPDAKVLDGRYSKEMLVVYDRVMARMHKPLPDGVVAIVEVTETKDKPTRTATDVFGVAGAAWSERHYQANVPDKGVALKVQEDWSTTGADAFFKNLAAAMPDRVTRSDGTTGYMAWIDPENGTERHPSGMFGGGAPRYLPGAEKLPAYDSDVTQFGPSTKIYPQPLFEGRYLVGTKVDLITDAQRPDLVGFSMHTYEETPDNLRQQSDFWMDAAHDDRPVRYVTTYYNWTVTPTRVTRKEVTEFGGYVTAPAPDSRSYPTTWTRTAEVFDKDGKASAGERVTTTFHLFPGRKLPEIPKSLEELP